VLGISGRSAVRWYPPVRTTGKDDECRSGTLRLYGLRVVLRTVIGVTAIVIGPEATLNTDVFGALMDARAVGSVMA